MKSFATYQVPETPAFFSYTVREKLLNDRWSLYAKHNPEAPAPMQMMRICLSE